MTFAMVSLVAHQCNPAREFGGKLLHQGSVRIQMTIVLPEEAAEVPVRLEAIANRLRRAQVLFMFVFDTNFFKGVTQCRFREATPSRHRQLTDVQQNIDIKQSESLDEILKGGALISDCVQLIHQFPRNAIRSSSDWIRKRIMLHCCHHEARHPPIRGCSAEHALGGFC